LGQPSTDTLKELYKNSEKASSGLRIGLGQQSKLQQQAHHGGRRNAWSCTFEHQECYMKLMQKHLKFIIAVENIKSI
jgi:ribosomal protein S6--L-glutamate ligase